MKDSDTELVGLAAGAAGRKPQAQTTHLHPAGTPEGRLEARTGVNQCPEQQGCGRREALAEVGSRAQAGVLGEQNTEPAWVGGRGSLWEPGRKNTNEEARPGEGLG